MPYDGWHIGAASSNINDIANDDFAQILHIDEPKYDDNEYDDSENGDSENGENVPMIGSSSNSSLSPGIQMLVSDNSTPNLVDLADSNTNQTNPTDNSFLTVQSNASDATTPMKQSSSDVSISFFLDRDDNNETFDENTFANVNANALSEQTRQQSDTNVTFLLDDQD